jgi:hypothetical protein
LRTKDRAAGKASSHLCLLAAFRGLTALNRFHGVDERLNPQPVSFEPLEVPRVASHCREPLRDADARYQEVRVLDEGSLPSQFAVDLRRHARCIVVKAEHSQAPLATKVPASGEIPERVSKHAPCWAVQNRISVIVAGKKPRRPRQGNFEARRKRKRLRMRCWWRDSNPASYWNPSLSLVENRRGIATPSDKLDACQGLRHVGLRQYSNQLIPRIHNGETTDPVEYHQLGCFSEIRVV